MVHRCDSCPGVANLENHLAQLLGEQDKEDEDPISFSQWVSTDRASLVTQILPCSKFVQKLGKAIDKLTVHHFVAKHQSAYARDSRNNLANNTALITMAFAENFSFLVQDAIQGYHWVNHPFSVYFNKTHYSYCVISDHLKHSIETVYTFQSTLLKHLKVQFLGLAKIIYFSDGAASQYKNFKNFTNLLHHSEDFGLNAEWNFYATSHGKITCDGIGGTIKRKAAKHSLQAHAAGTHLLTPLELFNFSERYVEGVKSFFVSSLEVQNNPVFCKLDLVRLHKFQVLVSVISSRW